MLSNKLLLEIIRQSFNAYLTIDTSRSTAKLKSLHGAIAEDIQKRLGKDFSVQSQGYGCDKEGSVTGRYYKKKVDITVNYDGKPVAGYAVKFVMRNYAQNSNNYFENMLGETANVRANNIPYFQIFIVFDKVPYYKKKGTFKRYDNITIHNIDKYILLSKDNPSEFRHTPDKSLVVILTLKEKSEDYIYANSKEYAQYYKSVISDKDLIKYSTKIEDNFDDGVILNDYEDFADRTTHIIMGRMKKTKKSGKAK